MLRLNRLKQDGTLPGRITQSARHDSYGGSQAILDELRIGRREPALHNYEPEASATGTRIGDLAIGSERDLAEMFWFGGALKKRLWQWRD